MRRTIALLATSAIVALPSAASAAPPWSAPVSVPGSQTANPATVGVALGDIERGVIGFSANAPQQTGAVAGFALGGPLPAQSLAPYDLAAPAVSYGNTRSILALRRTLDRDRGIARVAVRFTGLLAKLGEPQILDASVKLRDVALAADSNGGAALVWAEDKGYVGRRAKNDRLYLSLRTAGGRFGKPSVLVGSGKLGSVSVAYGPNGHLVVAFERQAIDSRGQPGPRRVQARYRTARGSFGPIDDLGIERGVTAIVSQVAGNGRAYVAWGTQDGGIEASEPYEVWATTRSASASRFRAASKLHQGDRSLERPRGRLSLAIDRSGADAVLAFTGIGRIGPASRTLMPVLVSSTDSAGNFGPPVLVPGANGSVGGIVVAPGGVATIVWTALKPNMVYEATGVLASTRPAGGAFPAVPEVVSATAPGPYSVPSIALPLTGGAPLVAWYEPATGILTSRRG